jgi:hypothetical protein
MAHPYTYIHHVVVLMLMLLLVFMLVLMMINSAYDENIEGAHDVIGAAVDNNNGGIGDDYDYQE